MSILTAIAVLAAFMPVASAQSGQFVTVNPILSDTRKWREGRAWTCGSGESFHIYSLTYYGRGPSTETAMNMAVSKYNADAPFTDPCSGSIDPSLYYLDSCGPTGFLPQYDAVGSTASDHLFTDNQQCIESHGYPGGFATGRSTSRSGLCPDGAVWAGNPNPTSGEPNPVCVKLNVKIKKSLGPSCPAVGDPINPGIGNKYEEEVDLAGGLSTQLVFSRFYNSLAADSPSPSLDPGWRHNFESRVSSFNDGGVVAIDKSNGRRYEFNWNGSTYSGDPDVVDRIVRQTDQTGALMGWLYSDSSAGLIEQYDADGYLVARTRIDGYAQSLNYVPRGPNAYAGGSKVPMDFKALASVVDSFGHTLAFQYNDQYYLSNVLLNGAYRVGYAIGDLQTSVSYLDGSSKIYSYADVGGFRNLTNTTDESGHSEATTAYDSESGAAISTELQPQIGGTYITYASDLSTATVVDALGNSSQYAFQTIQGVQRLASRSQPAGSGCNASTAAMSYDSNGNVLSADDFNGVRACSAYDMSRNLESTRVAGLGTGTACSSVLPTNATLPTGSVKLSKQWHPDWKFEIARAEPGKLTWSVYNGQPDPFNGNALASCAPADALLPDGKPIVVLCKRVEQATTDVDGSQGFSASIRSDLPLRQRTWTYNRVGQVLTSTDPLGKNTTYAYYTDTTAAATKGDLQSVTNALGQTTTFNQYNAMGQLLRSTDPNGVVTTNVYDLRQRLLSTAVGSETTSYSYDPAGFLTSVTLPNGATLSYAYDAARRLYQITDRAGNKVVYTLDAAGNRVSEQVQDAGGVLARNVTRSFDALNRLQQVTGARQ